MLRTTTTAWTALFLSAGLPLLATRALAQDAPISAPAFDPSGRYHFTGDVEGAFKDGTFLVTSGPGTYQVTATEKRKTGDVAWSGSATLVNRTLVVDRPEGQIGIAGALSGTGTRTTLEYVAVLDPDKDGAPVTVYRKDAEGHATQIGTATLESHVPFWEKQPGDLLALEEKIVDKAMHKELDLDKTFQVSTYASLGIGVGVQILGGSDLSDSMKHANRVFLIDGKGEPVWIRTIVQGGPTVSWGHTIPLGHASVSAGFSAGTVLRYVCDDQETAPTGLDDGKGMLATIKEVPAKAFQLPTSSDKALGMTEGARRSITGTGSLALSGGAAFGYRLDDLGALAGKVQVGVDAGVSVSWGISGNLELDFERLADQQVHVRWTRGGSMTTSAGVSFLLGLYVAPTEQDKLAVGLLHGPVVAVVNRGESYTCVQFNASESWVDSSQLVFDMTFDLADPAARVAYDAAVLGDLRAAQALAAAKDHAGLKAWTQTSTLTDQLSFSAHFAALQVLSIDSAHQTTNVHIDVDALDGTHASTDVYSYAKQVKGFFARLFGGGDRSLSSSASHRTVVAPDGKTTTGSTLAFTFDQDLDHASHEKVDEELAMAGSLLGPEAVSKDVEAVHAEQANKGFDHLKVHLEASFGSAAIARILAQDDEAFYVAYGAASTPGESSHAWDHDRIAYLGKVSLVQKNDATVAEEDERREAWDLYDATKLAKLLDKARSAGQPTDQVKQFRDLAKKAGFDLRTIIALANMAGRDDAHVAVSFTAKGLAFSEAAGQASALPSSP